MQFVVSSNVALKTLPENFPVTVILQDEFGATSKSHFTVKLLPDLVEDPNKEKRETDII